MAEERFHRRLAAILAADVVGYSRLMEKDEADTLARLKALRSELIDPRIAADGGRIVKTMGDGVLVEFASAVAAVENAIAIQAAIAERTRDEATDEPLQFRIGINLGDVIIDGDDIHGDGVNVAARLESLCEPGGVYVSGSVYDQVAGRVAVSFDDLGLQKVKNIERPVRVYKVLLESGAASTGTPVATSDRASIAVLPFTNMSGDAEQEYFSDGISEDIITALSRARWFRVVSRNSTFAYKGTSLDMRQIARELGVRYVLEGSVRKAGDRMRITTQLIDASTDDHLWAERFDRELADIFDVQDEITYAIAAQIEPELRRAEFNRAAIARSESLSVWDTYQRGMWHMYRKDDPDFFEALKHFRRAAQLDPNFGPCQSGIAMSCYFLVHFRHVDEAASYVDEGMQAARRAVELDGDDPVARWALGSMYYRQRNYEESIAALETAIRLDPHQAQARNMIGRILVDLGKYSECVEEMEESIRLCPNEPMIGIMMARMAEAYFHLHQYEKAIEWSRKALREDVAPRMWGRATLLAALGHSGKIDDARQALRDMLDRRPDFSLSFARDHYPLKIPEAAEHLVEGLLKAGVPKE